MSERAVELMTTNHLSREQITGGGPILGGRAWGYGMSVTIEPDGAWPLSGAHITVRLTRVRRSSHPRARFVSPACAVLPGRYGWAGGYSTIWSNDPHLNIVAMGFTQVSDVLWNGTANEFDA